MERWYPTKNQLATPDALHAAFKQLLDQHYALLDRVNAPKESTPTAASSAPPPGSGPADSMLLGLRVQPVDTAALADGTKLTYVKKTGTFAFL